MSAIKLNTYSTTIPLLIYPHKDKSRERFNQLMAFLKQEVKTRSGINRQLGSNRYNFTQLITYLVTMACKLRRTVVFCKA